MQPFWPTGSGCARGFLGVFDAIWMLRGYGLNVQGLMVLLAERESVYRLLAQAKPDNLHKQTHKVCSEVLLVSLLHEFFLLSLVSYEVTYIEKLRRRGRIESLLTFQVKIIQRLVSFLGLSKICIISVIAKKLALEA